MLGPVLCWNSTERARACVCVFRKPHDRLTWRTLGLPLAIIKQASSTGVTGIEKLWETRVRGEGKEGLGRGGGDRGVGGGGRQSRTYTEQRGFTLCHIRTVGFMWKAARQLSVAFKVLLRRTPRGPVTKYGPVATSFFKQTKMFLYLQLTVTD